MTDLGKDVTELLEAGIPRREIAKQLKCSTSTVAVWASKTQAKDKDIDKIGGLAGKIIKLRKNGLSYKEISKKLNCSRSSVSYYCAMVCDNDKIKDDNVHKAREARKERSRSRIKHLLSGGRVKEIIRNNSNRPKHGSSHRNMSTRVAKKLFLLKPSSYSCQNCGYAKCWSNLALHHKNPQEKDINFNRSLPLGSLVEEAMKCVVLCHNCHGEVHNGLLVVDELPNLTYGEIPSSPKKWLDKQIKNALLPDYLVKLLRRPRTAGDA